MPVTRKRAAAYLQAAGGNATRAAAALGMPVEELRALLGLHPPHRPPRTTPTRKAAQAALDAAIAGDRSSLDALGVRAVARALEVPESTVRARVAPRRDRKKAT